MFETFALQRMLCLSYFAQLHRKDCLKLFFAFCLLGEPCQEIYDHLLEVPVSRDQLNHYRNVAEDARSELAATLVKFECAQSELRDLRSKLLSKEAFCQELKAEMENYKENNARKSSLLTSLRDRVQELEEESAALTASKIRTEITAHTAIKENQELKKKVAELDESFQKCLKEIEENKNQVSKNCRQHEEFLAQLGDCLDPDKKNEKASYEDLILKLRELCEENAFVKGQIVTLEETINVHEMEAKASRETIMRLVSEVNRAQEKAASCTKEKGKLNQMVSQLEARISELVEQLGNESGFHQKALQRAQKAENKLEVLQGQLTHLEGELVSGDVLRDNLNFEKQKYLKFLDQLSEKMKLDQMAAELGFDMRLDVVLARTEQLVRLESNAVIENKTLAYNLQRKLRTQKERLESKELHMSLLRQKIAQLEGEKQVRSALAVERDEASLTLRKLQKKVERLQKELSVCREANTELKAKLADTSELKIKTLEQTKAIEDLNKSRDKLEKMKEKAEKKLTSVKSELDTTEREAQEDKERAKNMIEVVTNEMKTLKKSLEEVERREKQLVDFREVISKMLGLNMTSLALPDYEIIRCLERLIHSHQHYFVTCACLQDVPPRGERHTQSHLKLLH
ncbi:coiled-coil domain-containing protein 170 isoform X6 [Canis lupus familiaris]|uniref:coiled-coil domain-containing protein 170 isoform X5 n=1 Tax=Canis lupus dingo TaxID=286419 RepID=UPI0006B3C63D|nr:coiled-coil domain-containing protein 170 isoform X5 [Canis lupus dingo]XP_038372241.1 coiled-coil domain-containing protein 170 isoform X6 [Canis lupus familiaris]XP_038510385.1 coiled-coil domain-containing protein 170 isoform X6 [Canis lupus familiaris]